MATLNDIRKSFGGTFRVSDLEELGGSMVLTVTGIDVVEMKKFDSEEKEPKTVLLFEETPKQLPLNQTRLEQLVSECDVDADDDDALEGLKIKIYVDKMKIGNKKVEYIAITKP